MGPEPGPSPGTECVAPETRTKTLRLVGTIPPELWNRLGTRIIPKLRSGADLTIGVDFSVTIPAESVQNTETDLRQALEDLGLKDNIKIEHGE